MNVLGSQNRLANLIDPTLVTFQAPVFGYGSENKLNVFGSQNRLANLIDPKLVIFQASVFGYRFRIAPHPEMGSSFWIKSYPNMSFGFGGIRHARQQAW